MHKFSNLLEFPFCTAHQSRSYIFNRPVLIAWDKLWSLLPSNIHRLLCHLFTWIQTFSSVPCFFFVFMYIQSVVFRARETNFGTNTEEMGSVETVLIPWDNSSFRIQYLGQPWLAYRLLRADNIIRTFSFYWTEVFAFSNWSLESFWVWRLEDVDLLSSRVA
jgi:hypothetical protein